MKMKISLINIRNCFQSMGLFKNVRVPTHSTHIAVRDKLLYFTYNKKDNYLSKYILFLTKTMKKKSYIFILHIILN